jgi:hypothetical protein
MIKYTVYETTNLVNGKYYIGVHKTNNVHDEYVGSGRYITRAVAKYGIEKFVKVVLCIYDTQQEAWDKENQLVEIHRNDPLCMNMRRGGSGGFDWINKESLNNSVDNHVRATEALKEKLKEPEQQDRLRIHIKIISGKVDSKKRMARLPEMTAKWTGSHHTEESKKAIREAHLGEKNTFFGRKWMTHLEFGNKAVKKEDIETHRKEGWVFGRILRV